MLFVALIVALGFTWIALRDLRWAIFIVAALLPTYLIRFSIGPFPTTLLEVLLIITVLIWGFKYRGFSSDDPRLRPWRIPIILFLVAGLVGTGIAPDSWAALGLFRAYLLEPVFFFAVCVSTLRDAKDVRHLFGALGASAAAISLYAIIQRLTGAGIPAPWDTELRVTSFYPFPNAVGLFLAPLIPVFVALFLAPSPFPSHQGRGEEESPPPRWVGATRKQTALLPTSRRRVFRCAPSQENPGPSLRREARRIRVGVRIFWLVAAALSILAIIFSKTEAAWVGVAAGLFVLCVAQKRTRIPALIGGAAFLVILLGFSRFREPILQKLTLQDWSGHVHRTQWVETTAMLRDHTIFGAGLSGYPTVFRPYHQATYIEIFQYPHNIVLNFWSELGLLGLLAFIWIMIVFFQQIRRSLTYRLPVTGDRLLSHGLAAGVLTLAIHGLVDVPYFKNDLAVQFWIFAASITVIASEAKRSRETAASLRSSQ